LPRYNSFSRLFGEKALPPDLPADDKPTTEAQRTQKKFQSPAGGAATLSKAPAALGGAGCTCW